MLEVMERELMPCNHCVQSQVAHGLDAPFALCEQISKPNITPIDTEDNEPDVVSRVPLGSKKNRAFAVSLSDPLRRQCVVVVPLPRRWQLRGGPLITEQDGNPLREWWLSLALYQGQLCSRAVIRAVDRSLVVPVGDLEASGGIAAVGHGDLKL